MSTNWKNLLKNPPQHATVITVKRERPNWTQYFCADYVGNGKTYILSCVTDERIEIKPNDLYIDLLDVL